MANSSRVSIGTSTSLPAVSPPCADAPPRASLGGFRLTHKLASGGMASVYLGCRQGEGGQTEFAAIKVMLPSLVEEEDFIAMFLDEARLTSLVRHPNVCRALGFGQEEGLRYLAMEHVLGQTWRDVAVALHQSSEGRAAAPALLAHALIQVCQGLHEVHETRDSEGKHMRIVHRDLSPRNVMIDSDGRARLLDFGIAHAQDRSCATRKGVLKGHLAYVSPEQVLGKPVDRRTDLWALGVMLWEGVMGRRLFKRSSRQLTMRAITLEPLDAAFEAFGQRAPGLRLLLERCLARDPNERFASAKEMGHFLTRLTGVTGEETAGPLGKWMRHLFREQIQRKEAELSRAANGMASRSRRGKSRPRGALASQPLKFNVVLPKGMDGSLAFVRGLGKPAARLWGSRPARMVVVAVVLLGVSLWLGGMVIEPEARAEGREAPV